MGEVERLGVAAVVVNLNGGPMLDACLDALSAEGGAGIVVADNGSAPDELSRLEKRGDITLVRFRENRGFAGPANRGVAESARLPGSPPFVALVNNDCLVERGYMARCVEALTADPTLAAVQGVVLDGTGERVDGCGIAWNGRAEAVQLYRGEAPPAPGAPFAVPGVSATAAVYRRDLFLRAGGFEESFFAYYEDADLALRLARAGGRFACVPAARARHVGSATGRRAPAARWRHLFANRVRTLRRNLAPSALSAALRRPALRMAAKELGWPRAFFTALAAELDSWGLRGQDRRVRAALPPLAKLPT